MKCSRCRKNRAQFIVRLALDNKLSELKLCPDCLALKEEELGLKKGELALYALPVTEPDKPPRMARALKCRHCGTSYAQFRLTLKLGCPQCYKYFKTQLEDETGSALAPYKGRAYKPADKNACLKYIALSDEALNSELDSAVQAEDFEKAAVIRQVLRGRGK